MQAKIKTAPNETATAIIGAKRAMPWSQYRRALPRVRRNAIAAAGVESEAAIEAVQKIIQGLPAGGDWRQARRDVARILVGAAGDLDAPRAARRASHIISTQALQAYASGRYAEQIELAGVQPFWQYQTSEDALVRPAHAKLNGLILPAGDDFWRSHYPPWEWGCRCMVIALTPEQAAANGAVDGRKIPPGVQVVNQPPASGYTFDPAEGLETIDPVDWSDASTLLDRLDTDAARSIARLARASEVLASKTAERLAADCPDIDGTLLRAVAPIKYAEIVERLDGLGIERGPGIEIESDELPALARNLSDLSRFLPLRGAARVTLTDGVATIRGGATPSLSIAKTDLLRPQRQAALLARLAAERKHAARAAFEDFWDARAAGRRPVELPGQEPFRPGFVTPRAGLGWRQAVEDGAEALIVSPRAFAAADAEHYVLTVALFRGVLF